MESILYSLYLAKNLSMINQLLSVVIPAYNEEQYIETLLKKILSLDLSVVGFNKEVIVIDDGSTDNTFSIANSFSDVQCFRQNPNRGKGAAVKKGVQEAKGSWILIQDADLEYDPNDYLIILKNISEKDKILVYGSRILGQKISSEGILGKVTGKSPNQKYGSWLAGRILTVFTFIFFHQWITDTLTAYKLYPAKEMKLLNIETSGFETDHELTAIFIRLGYRIVEVPIHYYPRSTDEGKKIKATDGLKAILTIMKYRIWKIQIKV